MPNDGDDITERAYRALSNIYHEQDRLPESEEISLKLISLSRKKYGEQSLELADRLIDLGLTYSIEGRLIEAEELLQQSTSILQQKNDDESFKCARRCNYFALGVMYNHQNRINEAETMLMKSAEMFFKTIVLGTPLIARVYLELGDVLRKQNRLDSAQAVLLEAISILKVQAGEYKQDLLFIGFNSLIEICLGLEKWSECEAYLIQVIEILEKKHEKSYICVQAHERLTVVFLEQGKLTEAEAVIVKGIFIIIEQVGKTFPSLPIFYCVLAKIYFSQGRLLEAELVCVAAIDIMKSKPEEYAYFIETNKTLCEIYMQEGKCSRAEETAFSLIEVMRKRPGDSSADLADAYLQLGFIYYNQQKFQKAEPWLRKSLGMLLNLYGSTHVQVFYATMLLARICIELNLLMEGKQLFLRAIEIGNELPNMKPLSAELMLKIKTVMG